eukprot:3846602-Rhodomonas_salina.1
MRHQPREDAVRSRMRLLRRQARSAKSKGVLACGGREPGSASGYDDGDHVARPGCEWAVPLAAAGSPRTPQ